MSVSKLCVVDRWCNRSIVIVSMWVSVLYSLSVVCLSWYSCFNDIDLRGRIVGTMSTYVDKL